jgi:hypothetical protein
MLLIIKLDNLLKINIIINKYYFFGKIIGESVVNVNEYEFIFIYLIYYNN